MGTGSSKPDRAIEELPGDERYFGLENFGNTCYCNSVLQALYFCAPFRERVLAYYAAMQAAAAAGAPANGGRSLIGVRSVAPAAPQQQDNMLTCLAELFAQISGQRKRAGSVAPRRLVARVKAEHDLFSSYMHQDAHEFLNWLLNNVHEILEREERARARASRQGSRSGSRASSPTKARSPTKSAAALAAAAASGGGGGARPPSPPKSRGGSPTKRGSHSRSPSLQLLSQAASAAAAARQPVRTWVQELFQGRLVNETRCLRCETVTCREEDFFELPLEIDANSSLTACLKRFSSTETLSGDDKFFCDTCGCLQEAQKRMRLSHLPPVLCLHFKRFTEQAGRVRKLMHRVVFPFELKLWNVTPDCPEADAPYSLAAVVVHMGAHINHGHYVALIKSQGQWVCFDDDQVMPVSEAQVQSTFGHTQEPAGLGPLSLGEGGSQHADHGYILIYQRQQPEVMTVPVAVQQQQQQHHVGAGGGGAAAQTGGGRAGGAVMDLD